MKRYILKTKPGTQCNPRTQEDVFQAEMVTRKVMPSCSPQVRPGAALSALTPHWSTSAGGCFHGICKKKVLFHCRHLSVSSGDAWPRGCPVWRRPMAGGQDAWQAAPCTGQLAVSRASALLLRAVRIFKPNKPDVSGRRNSLSDFNCNLAPGTL